MAAGIFTAISNDELLRWADRLEAASCVMHGSAFQPAHKAYKIMRHLAKSREMDANDVVTLEKLIPEMRHFSGTIARPGSDTLQKAARLLSQILDEHGQRLH